MSGVIAVSEDRGGENQIPVSGGKGSKEVIGNVDSYFRNLGYATEGSRGREDREWEKGREEMERCHKLKAMKVPRWEESMKCQH